MPPYLASIAYGLLIVVLFRLVRERDARFSAALWLPTAWLAISASRAVSMWLDLSPIMESPDDVLEGSPVDRAVLTALLAGALAVLVARGQRTIALLRANWPLLFFFAFAGLSFIWADYPFVTVKRWARGTGDLLMILVVLTDPKPAAAIKRILTRVGFLLIPLSVLFIKYYPELGRTYHQWTWEPMFTGVSTNKNGLGMLCLIFGLASVWQLMESYRATKKPGRERGSYTLARRPFLAHAIIVAMVLWLFAMANSATAYGCFLVGTGLMFFASRPRLAHRPAAVHVAVALVILLATFGVLIAPEIGLAEMMGRDDTLTGRTTLWAQVLSIDVNRWVGTGYESFWLGARSEHFWTLYYWRPNQAHNGYLETFITLGWSGVALLTFLFVWGYHNISRAMRLQPEMSRLMLAYFVAAVLVNLTEAAIRGPLWIIFILSISALTAFAGRPQESRASAAAPAPAWQRPVAVRQSFAVSPMLRR